MPYKDKAKHREMQNRIERANREAMRLLKESLPCTDCGKHFPHYMLDWDHARGEKVISIGAISKNGLNNSKKLADELAKCDLVCKNCHGARTWFRSRLTNN
jgi:hypothetical protein